MNLLNEFFHDSYVGYRRWRATRKARLDTVPRNLRILNRIGVAFLVMFFLSGLGVIAMFGSGLWVQALILIPLLALVLVVWYRFLLWFEDKHVSAPPVTLPFPIDTEPRDW